MKPIDKAHEVMRQSIERADGYFELLHDTTDPAKREKLKSAIIRELQRFSDDDDLIDAMYEEDMRAEREATRSLSEAIRSIDWQ